MPAEQNNCNIFKQNWHIC